MNKLYIKHTHSSLSSAVSNINHLDMYFFYGQNNYFETPRTNIRSSIPLRTISPRWTYFVKQDKSRPRSLSYL